MGAAAGDRDNWTGHPGCLVYLSSDVEVRKRVLDIQGAFKKLEVRFRDLFSYFFMKSRINCLIFSIRAVASSGESRQ
jgi:hypothetical protein